MVSQCLNCAYNILGFKLSIILLDSLANHLYSYYRSSYFLGEEFSTSFDIRLTIGCKSSRLFFYPFLEWCYTASPILTGRGFYDDDNDAMIGQDIIDDFLHITRSR